MEILKFQDRICYLDYLVTLKTPKGQIVAVVDRFTEIRLPFNFIDFIPKEFTDYYTLINNKEHLNSDFYFSIGIVRDGRYYKKKSGNIINYLKNHLEHIRIGLYPEGYEKHLSNVTMFSNKEEYMSSEDCKELLLEFHESTPSKPVLTLFEKMIDNIIRKIN